MDRTGAAAVIIGNEILTAKVADANGPHLVRRLRDRGIPLLSMAVVPDDVDAIVEAVASAHRRASHVLTSGGIGPTHDDVTVRAVALALGRPVVRLEEMVRRIRDHFGERVPAEALRMADAPQGAELWFQEGTWFPILTCDGVHMLPGVPQLFRHQLETVLARLPGAPVHVRCLYLSAAEAEIAGALDSVALDMPQVSIGSYPSFDRAIDYSVKVTIEHADRAPVEEALERVRRALPQGSVLRVE
ncbi:MAG TPA: competence/damage-inducible protein A [Myxococcaceae bacterium]|jgi:molybdenum cofactor synthesis domain-containing protein